ncbi:hypothetical protein SFRURICE_008851 [Spodoptera frugiperda]|nr:hypothetical protein SFRURICE_008851 [Spodoptera frugiperda]
MYSTFARDTPGVGDRAKYSGLRKYGSVDGDQGLPLLAVYRPARTELDPCMPRVAFRVRLKEPSEYLRWCLVWLMPDPDLRTT